MGFLEMFNKKNLDGSGKALPDASRPTEGNECERMESTVVVEFQNPFMRSKCSHIHISIYNLEVFHNSSGYAGRVDFQATIQFKNGDTTGEQKIKAETFPALVEKINVFIKSMG